jgi:Chromo (CHRromatin Organisation MOdifier) domain
MPYKEMEEHGDKFVQPPPELINGQEEYEVEQIMNSRQLGHAWKLQYLLQWKGYSHAHDSWQDATEVHVPELVQEYHTRKWSAVHAAAMIKRAIGGVCWALVLLHMLCGGGSQEPTC